MTNSDPASQNSARPLAEEVRTLFSVISQTLDHLKIFLTKQGKGIPPTSYNFIGQNISYLVKYSARQLPTIEKKAQLLQNTILSSPLLISFYTAPEQLIFFEFRNTVRENAEAIRQLVMNIVSNIGSVLPAYIIVYEILEKFKLSIPFVLVESDSFSRGPAAIRLFGEYRQIEPEVLFEDLLFETITYSGVEIGTPDSLLLFGHEAFHIIDQYQFTSSARGSPGTLFEQLCQKAGVKFDNDNEGQRCNEAFIDALATLYLGPAYTVALRDHFERIYPISGERHAEMTSRLLLLLEIWRLQKFQSSEMNEHTLMQSLGRFKRLMTPKQQRDAERDLLDLTQLLNGGMIQFIKETFDHYGVQTYPSFYSFWRDTEAKSLDIDRMDEQKIVFCLKNNIPVATRPAVLLNLYMNNKALLAKLSNDTIVASIKKWYVKRYYQKARKL